MYLFKFLLLFFCLNNVFATEQQIFPHNQENESKNEFWLNLNKKEIENNLKVQESKRAKSVILFLGDGMGVSTMTAARIRKGQMAGKSGEESQLVWEKFPNVALIKTYNVDRLVPDSAGTATCYLSGVKSNYGVIGVNAAIDHEELDCKKIQANKVESIMEMGKKAGKSIGVVTTTRITDATPSAAYAHAAFRKYQGELPEETKKDGCKDIARQLIEDEPGQSLNVILGFGSKMFVPKTVEGSGRNDDLDLIKKWKEIKSEKFSPDQYKYIETVDELNNIDPNKVEHLFGLFGFDWGVYNTTITNKNRKTPTLREMTEMAIKILSKNKNGYILLVEGANIDVASHENQAYQALHETIHLDQTVENALKIIDEETLVLVTADHSHTLNINGHPLRGTNIFGLSHKGEVDNNMQETSKKFTILSYGTGPGKIYLKERLDPEKDSKVGTPNYVNNAAVRAKWAYHGGEDVALFSNGWPNLVRGSKDQSYVGNLIAYTSCMGIYTDAPHCDNENEKEKPHLTKYWWIYLIAGTAILSIIGFAVFLKRKSMMSSFV